MGQEVRADAKDSQLGDHPRRVYLNRRAFMRNLMVAGGATIVADTVWRSSRRRTDAS